MAVKTVPIPFDLNALSAREKSHIEAVSTFLNFQTNGELYSYGEVASSLGLGPQVTWQSLDRAWNNGLIAQAGNGRTCLFCRREPRGPSFYELA